MHSNVEGVAMWWLIWIAIMLLTPIVAGVRVWLQLRAESNVSLSDAVEPQSAS